MELLTQAQQDIEKLELTIDSISLNADNWIVSEIRLEGYEVVNVELKPLDVSSLHLGLDFRLLPKFHTQVLEIGG